MCSCFFCDSPCLQRAFMSMLRVSFKVLWNQEGSFLQRTLAVGIIPISEQVYFLLRKLLCSFSEEVKELVSTPQVSSWDCSTIVYQYQFQAADVWGAKKEKAIFLKKNPHMTWSSSTDHSLYSNLVNLIGNLLCIVLCFIKTQTSWLPLNQQEVCVWIYFLFQHIYQGFLKLAYEL